MYPLRMESSNLYSHTTLPCLPSQPITPENNQLRFMLEVFLFVHCLDHHGGKSRDKPQEISWWSKPPVPPLPAAILITACPLEGEGSCVLKGEFILPAAVRVGYQQHQRR